MHIVQSINKTHNTKYASGKQQLTHWKSFEALGPWHHAIITREPNVNLVH